MTHTTQTADTAPLILIPGYWLGAWAWDEVVTHLAAGRLTATALTLPGLDPLDPDRATRTLEDQVTAIERAVQTSEEPVILVAHSGANGPVTQVIDRHPERIRRVVWVDSGPATAGAAFDADFPGEVQDMPLPAFEELRVHASIDGLSEEQLDRFRSLAVPQPGPVVRQPVTLTNHARFQVPTTFICSSLPSAQVHELAAAGHPMFAEVGNYVHAEFVDLPTGHWPMWSRPTELAKIFSELATAA